MKRISIIGTGVMGEAITKAYIRKGYQTTVWNRTPSKTKPLTDIGSSLAETVSGAVKSGDLIIAAFTSYEDLANQLEPLDLNWEGKVLVNISSGTPERARAFGEYTLEHNMPYLDAAAMSGVRRIGDTEEGLFLFSGQEKHFKSMQDVLQILGKINYLGEDFGLTPLYDSALFTMAWGSLIGFYNASAFVESEGLDVRRFASVAGSHTPFINSLFREHSSAIHTGQYPDDDGNLAIHASAMQHVVAVSREKGLNTIFPEFLASLFEKGIANGLAEEGIASVFKILKKQV